MADLAALARSLRDAGANLTVTAPGRPPLRIGSDPGAARVVFHHAEDVAHLVRGDHLALAEAYLAERIDLHGELAEVVKLTEVVELEASRLAKLRFALAGLLRRPARRHRESIAFHYDRPPGFFLPWLDRWRSYAHGFYTGPDDSLEDAQARKMQHAIDALGLAPGMRVLDMGGGWGCFVEYAGRKGIRVESITISEQQHAYVTRLIQEHALPCTSQLVDLHEYAPRARFDGAVFLGTFEHMTDYPFVARFLARHLAPEARVYADFCAQRESFLVGAFMARHVWPGTATYVNVPRLLDALIRAGLNVHELEDDTLSYAYTVRDWARRLESVHKDLAAEFGEAPVRAFLLFLWGSWHFLTRNRTQAYHLVAGLAPRPPRPPRAEETSAAATAATHRSAKRSPTRP